MRGKVKMVLLAAFLCLVLGSQSVEMVQASVNYEACPYFCGTSVDRYETTKILDMKYLDVCTIHNNCDIYYIEYGRFWVVSCQTPGCNGYNPGGTLMYSWKTYDAHVNQ